MSVSKPCSCGKFCSLLYKGKRKTRNINVVTDYTGTRNILYLNTVLIIHVSMYTCIPKYISTVFKYRILLYIYHTGTYSTVLLVAQLVNYGKHKLLGID